MAFKITPDIVQSALKATITTRTIEAESPVVREAREQEERVKEKVKKSSKRKKKRKKKKKQITDGLHPAPIIQGMKSEKKIVPTDGRGRMLNEEEFRVEIQDTESRPEDFVALREVVVEKTPPPTEVLAAGKRHLSVDTQVFGPRTADFVADTIENNNRFVMDALRGRAGKYWTVDEKGKNFTFVEQVVSSVRDAVPYTFNVQEAHNAPEESDFGRTRQWVALKGNRKFFENARGEYSPDLWRSYVRGGEYVGSSKKSKGQAIVYSPSIRENEFFFDHVYELPVPFVDKEIKEYQVPQGALVAEINHEYNFYIKDYEETVTRRKDVLDNTLPNLYVFMSELRNEEPNPEFNNFISLDDTIATSEQLTGLAARKVGREPFDIKKHPIGQYFDLYAHQYTKAVQNGSVERLARKFSNIAVPIEEIDLFNRFNEKSEMFPMLVDIRLGTDKTTTFAQILSDSQLTNAFMARVINRAIRGESANLDTQVASEIIVQREGGDNRRKVSRFESMGKRIWNVAELVEDLRQGDEQLDPERAVFLGNHEEEIRANSGPQFQFFKSLMFAIFLGKFQSLVKQKFRTFEEVMSGEPAYSETVMYRIAKFEFNNAGQPIQNFWLPNSNDIDVLRFLDTQVKYNKRYFYKVWAYQLVIGTRYWYTDLDADSYDHHATFMANMEPSIQLIETPYLETSVRVTDKPPVPPDVDIIPFKGNDSEMKFYMKGNVGEFDAEPVLIQPTDAAIFNTIRDSQSRGLMEKITFGADDQPSVFQIFRLTERPKSYGDFTGNLWATINTDVNLESLQGATSAAFVDQIMPNTKYYYIVRTIDVHGHLSNPTPVFEVEVINENGLVFPTIRCVEFQEMARGSEKPARRFIQIVPNVLQSLINEEKSGYEDAQTAADVERKINLGVTTDAVWDKRFKIRLTSKSTGKKIELNIGFEHKNAEKA